MNKNQVKGRMKQAKGKAKEMFGRVTGNKTLKFKGKATRVAGKTQVRAGNIQKKTQGTSKS
ncbi:MAG: CsbD family protein [Melioribacteraceae bacterium]|nr:CsbD family protein [Melioribacteraceae bacterium]